MSKILICLICFLPLISLAQGNKDDLIFWQDGSLLKWSDYKGNADPNANAAASTATYLGIEYTFDNNRFGYKITCSFSKSKQ